MPPEVSALAISEFFTLSGAELQAVLSRYGVDMRRGAALQIDFLKMCGRSLDKLLAETRVILYERRYVLPHREPWENSQSSRARQSSGISVARSSGRCPLRRGRAGSNTFSSRARMA
jgi:hypothetical protein